MTAIHSNKSEEIFKRALHCHRTGDLLNAEGLYKKIIQMDPIHADGLHLLGLIKHQTGDMHEASVLISKAITVAPDFPGYHISLGDVYADMGTLNKAISQYQAAIELDPRHYQAYFHMGNAFFRMNDFVAAVTAYEKALKIKPDLTLALNNQGLAFHTQKDFKNAAVCFKKALKIDPSYADAYNNLGNAQAEMGMSTEAVASYQKAFTIDPLHFDALYNLGNLYHDRKEFKQAISCYHQALSLKPDHVDLHINLGKTCHVAGNPENAFSYYQKASSFNGNMPELDFYMGNALLDQHKNDQALVYYERLVRKIPQHVDGWINMGIAYHNQDRLDDAVRCYNQALDADPHNAKAFNNLGKTFRDQGNLKNAFFCYQKAIELSPAYAEAHVNHAFCLLLAGRFTEGWPEYEWRLAEKEIFPKSDARPLWDGTDCPEKSIMVHAEQGIGDEIMFASCLPDLVKRVGRCTVACDQRLKPLFDRSFPGIRCVERHAAQKRAPRGVFASDMKIAMGSLPLHFRNHPDNFPKPHRYLAADPVDIQKWRMRFQGLGQGICVGISWRAGKQQNTGRLRSIALNQWETAFSVPGIHLINLQYGSCDDEIRDVHNAYNINIHTWSDADPLKDMDDFAAQISALDLVVSVDNSTVHLAGGLGIPVWTLIPHSPDWRWMMDRKGTHWYASMRLFRQASPGNWTDVFLRIKTELEKFIFYRNSESRNNK